MPKSKTTNLIFGLMAFVTILLILIIAVLWKMTGDTRDKTRREYEFFQNDLFQQTALTNKSMMTLFKIINYDYTSQEPDQAVAYLEVLTRAAILHLNIKTQINNRILDHLPKDDPLLLRAKIIVTNETLLTESKWLSMLNQELERVESADRLTRMMSDHHGRMHLLVEVLNDNLNLQSQIQGVFFSMLKNNIAITLQRINILLYVLLPLFLLNVFLLVLHLKAQKKSRVVLQAAHDDLEQRVDHRTRELKLVNRQLQSEVQERVISESSLQQSEKRFRSLATSSPVGIFQTSVDGAGIYVNEKICEFTGLPAKAHLGMGWIEAIHPDDHAYVTRTWRQVVEGDGDFNIKFRYKNRQDDVTWVSATATPLFDDEDRKTGYLGTLTNITDIKLAEVSLRESEQKYRSMMEAMKDGVYIVSDDRRILYLNPAMIQKVGRDATGEICHEALFDSDKPCDWCVFDMVKAGKSIEYEMVHPVDKHHYLVSNSPIPHENGSCSKLSIFHDMTHIKEMENRLHQAQKMESIGTLTGGIAHDFNNILGIIIGNTELALDDVPEWNPAHFNLEEIKTASLRAKDIVRQLLSFSRRTEQRLQPLKIVPVIEDALRLMRSIIPASIEIQTTIKAADEFVMANATQINQVLMNLCTNASQEMEDTGGRLELWVEALVLGEDMPHRYRDLALGPYIMVSVKDSGRGIRPEIIDRIFDPYFSTKEVGQGSGMGLAVVHGIIDNHGGKIYVDSQPGMGTTFTILLPQSKGIEADEALSSHELPMGSESIMLVDDEPSIISMTGNVLRRLGYEVEATTSPGEALDMIRTPIHRFDLLITDMAMPEMTGAGLSREVLSLRPDMPVIICTGHSAMMDEHKARELGIAAFIMKPVEMRELAAVVRRVLDNRPTDPPGEPVATGN